MKRTQTGSGRELVKIRLLSMMSIQEPDHVCNSFVIIHTGSLSSLTFDAHPLLATILAEYFPACENQPARTRRPNSRARAAFASSSS